MDITEYNNQHQACPNCGSNKVYKTLLGGPSVIHEDYEELLGGPSVIHEDYEDDNRARCDPCGWKGIVHNLLPFTPPTIVKGEE